VRVGPGDRDAVDGQQTTAERSPRSGAARGLGENARGLVGYPVLAEPHDSVGKRLPLGRVANVGKDARVKDDERGTPRGLAAELRKTVSEQIALHHPGLARSRDPQGSPQMREPLRLLGPDQRLQPCPLRRICGVERIEVQPCPPDDVRHCRRHGCRRAGPTGKGGRFRLDDHRTDQCAPIIVAVEVGQQTKRIYRAESFLAICSSMPLKPQAPARCREVLAACPARRNMATIYNEERRSTRNGRICDARPRIDPCRAERARS
jgi:hypothetical protein